MAVMERFYISYIRRDLKIVETIHGISDPKTNLTIRDRIEKFLIKYSPIHVSARCYISKGVQDKLINNLSLADISDVCYNPIEFPPLQPKQYRLHSLLNLSNETQIIGTSCRISFVKNPQAFTEVMAKVLYIMPKVHAVVMGNGDKDIIDECIKILNNYDVNNRFHWLGYQKDAPTLVRDLDCFVMTSRSEGLPTSLLECFANGTPVAMLEGEGGLKDIALLNSTNEPIVVQSPHDDLGKLSEKIINLLNDQDQSLKQAENAYLIGKKNFDITNVASHLSTIYHQIISKQ